MNTEKPQPPRGCAACWCKYGERRCCLHQNGSQRGRGGGVVNPRVDPG